MQLTAGQRVWEGGLGGGRGGDWRWEGGGGWRWEGVGGRGLVFFKIVWEVQAHELAEKFPLFSVLVVVSG